MIKSVIFDVDGVLIDSFDANYDYFNDLFRVAGYISPTIEEYRQMFHLSLDDMIRLIAKDPDEIEFKRIRKIGDEVVYKFEKMKNTRGAVETVKILSEKYRLAIVTGRQKSAADDYINHSGLGEYFETVVNYGDYENPKPHPEPLLVALERLGIVPDEAVYVGDQKTDLESARAAGIPFILHSEFDYGLNGVNFRVENFNEIVELIESMEK